MNEYQLNVRKVAEKMAAASMGETDLTQYETKEDWISLYTPQARIAISLQAESFKQGINCGHTPDVWEDNVRLTIEEMMIHRGLIDPTKCQYCDTTLTTDKTGTYCDNNKCDQFWQTK
jgi:hypothetical protein